jgi:hypothetical protein
MTSEPPHIVAWMTALAALRRFDGPLIKVIEHDYKHTFIEVHKDSRFISYTTTGDSIETTILDEVMLKPKDNDFNDQAYYFYTTNLKQMVLGLPSADRLVSRVVRSFIHRFGYMSMEVHIVRRPFKSTGDVEISVLVVDTEFSNSE